MEVRDSGNEKRVEPSMVRPAGTAALQAEIEKLNLRRGPDGTLFGAQGRPADLEKLNGADFQNTGDADFADTHGADPTPNFAPPESFRPRSPTIVSSPWGRPSMNSRAWAAFAARCP